MRCCWGSLDSLNLPFSSVSNTSARLFTLPARARASKPSVDALCGFPRISFRQVFGLGQCSAAYRVVGSASVLSGSAWLQCPLCPCRRRSSKAVTAFPLKSSMFGITKLSFQPPFVLVFPPIGSCIGLCPSLKIHSSAIH